MVEAFKLMLTGMSTVFVILILVVFLGHLIIIVTNKLHQQILPATENDSQSINPRKMAVIIAAVEDATQGIGNIASIKKIENK